MALLQLPNEVLACISAYLPLSDRTALACTCSRMYHAQSWAVGVTCPSVTMEDGDLVRAICSLESSNRPIREIVFKSTDLQRECIPRWKEFWRNLGHGIASLEFQSCDISERAFISVLRQCSNLERLVIDDCNSLLMSGKLLEMHVKCVDDVPQALLSLRTLELCNNRYLSDALFNRLVLFSENLEEVSLAGCQISFHGGIFKRFYPAGVNGVASESVLTFQNLMKFLERQSSKLKCLDFGGTSIDDSALERLAKLPDLNLEELYLTKCVQLTERGIEALCTRQPSLHTLNVTQCHKLGDGTASLLASQARRLKSLSMSGVTSLTRDGIVELAGLDQIVHLDLSACMGFDSLDLRRTLCTPTVQNMVRLNLSSCALQESDVVDIVGHLTRLRHLDLSSCRSGVTDLALHAISRCSRWLRTLHLAWCTSITDFGLTGRHYKLPILRHEASYIVQESANRVRISNGFVHYSPTNAASFSPVVDSCGQGVPLHNLRGLRELNLCGCAEITDIGLKVAIQFLELTKLDLSNCQRVTDSGLVAVGAVNKSLENVVLSHCREITEIGLTDFAIFLPRLRHLDIQGCHKIGNISIEALRKYCPDLHHLEASVCSKSQFQVGTPLGWKRQLL